MHASPPGPLAHGNGHPVFTHLPCRGKREGASHATDAPYCVGVHSPAWIELAGVVNMRDLGGLPTTNGRVTLPGRLIRSDNLQELPAESVHTLVQRLGLRDVVDLRTDVEVAVEGDGPLLAEPLVTHHHLTLYREDDSEDRGIPAAERTLPWVKDEQAAMAARDSGGRASTDVSAHDQFWSGHYLRYLQQRPDNVLAAMRVIAHSPGAVVVHCAAGKDRTGTVVGLALKLVGVTDEAVVADFAASAERVQRILDRLRSRPAYAANLRDKTVAQQSPQAHTMTLLLGALEREYGGVEPYLNQHGWTPTDSDAMRRRLVGGAS